MEAFSFVMYFHSLIQVFALFCHQSIAEKEDFRAPHQFKCTKAAVEMVLSDSRYLAINNSVNSLSRERVEAEGGCLTGLGSTSTQGHFIGDTVWTG